MFGTPPVATTTTSGVSREHVGGLGVDVAADGDAEPRAFGEPPVDDAHDLAPPLEARGDQRPARRARRRPRTRRPRARARRRPAPPRARAGPAPTTTTLRLGPSLACDDMRDRRLAPGRRVVDADRLARNRSSRCNSPCRRRGGSRARGLPRLSRAICGSARWARVMPTMSSLPLSIAWRAVATSWMRAAWKVGIRVAARTSPAKSRCGAERCAHAGDDMGERLVGVDMAADHVDEVDQARGGEPAARSRRPLPG